jgi:dTDP-4-dehydrorhamnose 3,5-epimerase
MRDGLRRAIVTVQNSAFRRNSMDIRVIPTALAPVRVIETDFFRDERGFFMESYHRERYRERGVVCDFVQDNHSSSAQDVLRGIHYQGEPAPMTKLVRCTVGAIWDVAVDLRAGSPTFGRWVAVELSAQNMKQILVPAGFGHAFLTLTEPAEVQYKCSCYYTPEAEGTVAWNDPDIGIAWPCASPTLSRKDREAPSLKDYLKRPAFRYEGRG